MEAQTFLLLASLLLCSISLLMCDNRDDNDDDDNDSGQGSVDFFEGAHCEGYNYPECGTAVDRQPHLNGVSILIDGSPVNQPVSIGLEANLTFAIEFAYPGNQLCGGHIFIVKNGESYCLDKTEGTITDESFPMGIPSMCYTEKGEPLIFKVDPSIFLNGEGAPYFLEISNDCATHSNRLLLDIVTVAE
ncbi:MAG: hypothetical protein GX444_12230 [Myxococcales bacterium]|nr:hypothetical protein [Myxococcales bacterium]